MAFWNKSDKEKAGLLGKYGQRKLSDQDLKQAEVKASRLGEQLSNFKLMVRMVKDAWSGKFKLPKFELAIAVGCIAYVLSPIDSIPDLIPALGWLDDTAIVAYAFSKLSNVLTLYKATLK